MPRRMFGAPNSLDPRLLLHPLQCRAYSLQPAGFSPNSGIGIMQLGSSHRIHCRRKITPVSYILGRTLRVKL